MVHAAARGVLFVAYIKKKNMLGWTILPWHVLKWGLKPESIQSAWIYFWAKVAILACNIVHFIFKKKTFTLLQQPKFCHFLIAEWHFFLYLFAWTGTLESSWFFFCRESKKSGSKLHETTAIRSLAACPFLLRSVSVECFPGHAADHQRQRAAQGTGPRPPSPSTPPTGVPETLRPPSPVARVRLWPRIHEQKNSKVSNG